MELDTFRIDFHERHPDKDTPPHSPTETYVPSSDEEYMASSDEEYYYSEEEIERNELNPKVKEFIVYDNSFYCMCLLDFISYIININSNNIYVNYLIFLHLFGIFNRQILNNLLSIIYLSFFIISILLRGYVYYIDIIENILLFINFFRFIVFTIFSISNSIYLTRYTYLLLKMSNQDKLLLKFNE